MEHGERCLWKGGLGVGIEPVNKAPMITAVGKKPENPFLGLPSVMKPCKVESDSKKGCNNTSNC